MPQVSLTAIFVLFLLFSPVQRDFSPVMQGVFQSMELYLKLKTARDPGRKAIFGP